MASLSSRLGAALVLISVASLPFSCAMSSNADLTSEDPWADAPGAPSGGGSVDDPGCEGPLGAPRDPFSLPACCPEYGGAHCVDSVPAELGSFVMACEGGGHCVPDDFIATGGVFTPRACQSLGGPGVCLSLCVPEVAQYAALLPQDVCSDSELCTPCVSPLDGSVTGACDLAFTCDGQGPIDDPTPGDPSSGDDPNTCEHEGPPVLDPAILPSCCDGAHCVDNALIPSDQASALSACDGSSMCVPDEIIESGGDFILETCQSVAGVEGRCVSRCLPEAAAQADNLPQDICPLTHVCAPCYDPFTGDDTGTCRFSCDPGPAGPPETLPSCCSDLGTCLPSGLVPADQASQLGTDVCPSGQGLLCVPSALVPGAAPIAGDKTNQSCTTSFFFQLVFNFDPLYKDGVCLPTCMPSVDDASFLIGDGSCDDSRYKCVPCNDPQNEGAPTGACNG